MPTFERLEWMPPTIDLIKRLDALHHEVICITVYPSKYLQSLNLKNVRNIYLFGKEISLQNTVRYIRGVSGLLFRIDTFIKKVISKKLKRIVDRELVSGGKLWVVNEMTVLLAGTSFLRGKDYYFTIYELHERGFHNRKIEIAAKRARKVIVPEYCRAHIMKSRYNLERLPIIMPNKSEIAIDNAELSEDALKAIASLRRLKLKGYRIVVYMGGLGPERPLEPFLSAISKSEKYILAIMGRNNLYLADLQKKYPDKMVYLGAFSPPEHICVAKYADIGLLNYVSINQKQGLNALFCAPNKIYEYTALGLPVLGNDIPGLKFDIVMNKCGLVVDYNDSDSVLEALEEIEGNYESYSARAKNYYLSTDVDKILEHILCDNC